MPLALVCIYSSSLKLYAVFLQQFNKGGVTHEAAVNIYEPIVVNYHLGKYILKTRASSFTPVTSS